MARAIQFKNIDWLGEPTITAHQVGTQWSTEIRFTRADGTGQEVIGRIPIAPEHIASATEEQYLRALQESLKRAAGEE